MFRRKCKIIIRNKCKKLNNCEILTFVTDCENSSHLQLFDERTKEKIVSINITDLLKNDIDIDMDFYSFLLNRTDTIIVNYDANVIVFQLYI